MGGGGSARNYGLDLAQGDYVQFLDQDDVWVENLLSEGLVRDIENNMCDVVAFSYCNGNQDVTRVNVIRRQNAIIREKSFEKLPMFHHSAYYYKRSFLIDNGIYTDRYNGLDYNYRNEDIRFLIQVHALAKSIQCVDRPLFIYRNNESSVVHTSTKGEEILCSCLSGYKKLAEETHNEDIKRVVCYYRTRYFLELLEYLSCMKDADKTGRAYYEQYGIDQLIHDGFVSDFSKHQYELWNDHPDKFWKYKRKDRNRLKLKNALASQSVLRTIYHFKKYPIKREAL